MRKNKSVFAGWRGVAAACAAACAALVAAWFFLRGGDGEEDVGADDVPVQRAPKARPRKMARSQGGGGTTRGKNGNRPTTRRRGDRHSESRGRVGDHKTAGGAETNAAGVASDAVPRKEPMFKHGTEQLLALATPSAPGMPVPPLPMITDESVAEDLAKAMRSAIGPTSNDTIRTLEIKKNVAEQKEEFRELREGGMTFVQYVNALRDKFNDEAEYISETRKLDEKLFNDAGITDEQYKAYRAELNKSLRERGLPELEER